MFQTDTYGFVIETTLHVVGGFQNRIVAGLFRARTFDAQRSSDRCKPVSVSRRYEEKTVVNHDMRQEIRIMHTVGMIQFEEVTCHWLSHTKSERE